jgi:hypothetical protein
VGRADLAQECFHADGVNDGVVEGDERAGEAGLGREADGEVKVGAAAFEHGAEEGVYGGHGRKEEGKGKRDRRAET